MLPLPDRSGRPVTPLTGPVSISTPVHDHQQAQRIYWKTILDYIHELRSDDSAGARAWYQAQPCLSGKVQGWARMNSVTHSVRMSMHRCSVRNPADCPRCSGTSRILSRRRREFVDVIREGALRIDADRFLLVTADYDDPIRVPDGKRIHRVLGGSGPRWEPAIDGSQWCAETWTTVHTAPYIGIQGATPPSTVFTVSRSSTPPSEVRVPGDCCATDATTTSSFCGHGSTAAEGIVAVRTGYLILLGGNTEVNIGRLMELLDASGANNLRVNERPTLDDAWQTYNLAYARCQWEGLTPPEIATTYLERRRRGLRCFIKLGPGFNGQIKSDRMRNVVHVDAPEVVLTACSNRMKKVYQLGMVRERLSKLGIPESDMAEVVRQVEFLLDSKIYRITKDRDTNNHNGKQRPGVGTPDEGDGDAMAQAKSGSKSNMNLHDIDELKSNLAGLKALTEDQFEQVLRELRRLRSTIEFDEPRPGSKKRKPGTDIQ